MKMNLKDLQTINRAMAIIFFIGTILSSVILFPIAPTLQISSNLNLATLIPMYFTGAFAYSFGLHMFMFMFKTGEKK